MQPPPPDTDRGGKAAYWLTAQRSPIRTEFGPIVATGVVTLAAGAVAFLALATRHGSGALLIIEFVAAFVCLGAAIGLFGFGIAATLRRGAWLILALGVVFTPLVYFVWALYRLRTDARE